MEKRDKMLHKLLLTTALLAALATPAAARLQITLNSGGSTFSCFDGQLSCDQSGGANNLLIVDQTVGGVLVQIALTQSISGATNELQLSSSSIVNENGVPATIKLFASDTDFLGPVHAINNSGSLTFNSNVGAPDRTLVLRRRDEHAGSEPSEHPRHAPRKRVWRGDTDPESFAGSLISPFDAAGPYSMTERRPDASRSGFDHGLQPINGDHGRSGAITWVMMLLGFVGLGYAGRKHLRDQLV